VWGRPAEEAEVRSTIWIFLSLGSTLGGPGGLWRVSPGAGVLKVRL
jgi:hypothetical protein